MAADDEAPSPSDEAQAPPDEGQPASDEGQAAPSQEEEELRRRLDDELRKLRIEDVLLQSVVSLINLTSRRIAKPDEKDLDQAKLGIDAVRALVDLLPAEPAVQVRQALSELQVAYASEAGGAAPAPEGGEPGPGGPPPPGTPEGQQGSGLWTPPGSS